MSKWAQAKQLTELDWRHEWQEVYQGTVGEQPAAVVALVLALDGAYHAKDRARFLDLKLDLVNRPSWTGSRPISKDCHDAKSERLTGASIQAALPI